jgi:hypothetical protein
MHGHLSPSTTPIFIVPSGQPSPARVLIISPPRIVHCEADMLSEPITRLDALKCHAKKSIMTIRMAEIIIAIFFIINPI